MVLVTVFIVVIIGKLGNKPLIASVDGHLRLLLTTTTTTTYYDYTITTPTYYCHYYYSW